MKRCNDFLVAMRGLRLVLSLMVITVCLTSGLQTTAHFKGNVQKKNDSQTQDDGAQDRIVPGKRIAKLSVGMTAAEVFDLMGDAKKTEPFADGRFYDFGSLRAFILTKTSRVYKVFTEDPQFTTSEGIRVGSSVLSLEAKYGMPERTHDYDSGDQELWYKHRSIMFMVNSGGKIFSIGVWPPD